MNNIMEIKDYLLGLEGVNSEMLDQSLDKHFACISDLTLEDLEDRRSIYDNYGIGVVKKDLGVVDFKSLARNPEEIINYCEENRTMDFSEADSYGRRSAA